MFTDFWGGSRKPIQWNPIFKMLSKYYEIELTHSPDFLLYSCFGYEYLKYDCIRIFITGENTRPNFEECDYAFSFDFPNSERNYRLPLYRLYKGYDDLLKPRTPDVVLNQDRKFCSFLVSNDVPDARIHLFDLLSEYKKVDSGGKFRNNIGNPVPRGEEISWLGNYKFNITFENSSYPGYTTEKLMHALVSNTIPIYWGNPLVGQDFNTGSFINCHDYNTLEDVLSLVKDIDGDPALYNNILSQPFLPGGEEIPGNREENIVARFAQIFSEGYEFVSKSIKRSQRLKFPILNSRKYFNKIVKPKIKTMIHWN